MRFTLLASLPALSASICHAQNSSNGAQELPQEQPVVTEIAPPDLATMLKNGTILVIDVNEDFTYAEAHVPSARLMVYDEITADKLPPDHQTPLVFYCYSPECPAAGMAAKSAVALGFVNVYCMKAGITGWQDAGLPTEP